MSLILVQWGLLEKDIGHRLSMWCRAAAERMPDRFRKRSLPVLLPKICPDGGFKPQDCEILGASVAGCGRTGLHS